jgi:hypothetical protein
VPAVPANANAIADFPPLCVCSERIDHAGDLMTGRARVSDSWKEAFFGHRVAMVNAAGLYPDPGVSGGRLTYRIVDQLEAFTGASNSHFFHDENLNSAKLLRRI